MNGDWESTKVQWFTGPACDFSKETWAHQVAWALLPGRLQEIPRNRWLTKLNGLYSTTLMSCIHNLFECVIPLWLASLSAGGAKKVRAQVREAEKGAQVGMLDDLHNGDVEDAEGGAVFNRPRRPQEALLGLSGCGPPSF
jgi:hypothetical protein